MNNLNIEELAEQVKQLKSTLELMQTQLHSQKLLVRSIVEIAENNEEIADRYQDLLDDYEKTSHQMMPNLLISC